MSTVWRGLVGTRRRRAASHPAFYLLGQRRHTVREVGQERQQERSREDRKPLGGVPAEEGEDLCQKGVRLIAAGDERSPEVADPAEHGSLGEGDRTETEEIREVRRRQVEGEEHAAGRGDHPGQYKGVRLGP